MDISIIIVNYNVRYFLSTCLQSVEKGIESIDAEVFVVDNNSTDDSVEMLRNEFPWVRLIANKDNRGFSRANNQAIERATGRYILLLNPDTIVEESCFRKCIDFMDSDSNVGGLGVKMIDGSGRFLPESKRGLPTPLVSFYKIFGLSKLFPKSRIFGKYHLGYLDTDKINDVDVLSGAFMLLRKSLIDRIGGLDEDFFMYGEDIDLSYRITSSGHRNIYFPETSIIHFKGESTKKSSVNYVLVFYRAMIIFARKHFSSQNASIFSMLINMAVYFRATIALLRRFLERVYLVLIDIAFLYMFLSITKDWYEFVVLNNAQYYVREVDMIAFPAMIGTWILGQLIFGGYRQPVSMKSILKGLLFSGLLIVSLYAMLSEEFRFSRAIIAITVLGTFILIPLLRLTLKKLRLFQLIRFSDQTTGIIGSSHAISRIENILGESPERRKSALWIDPEAKSKGHQESGIQYCCSLYQLKDFLKVYKPDELIYSLSEVSASQLIASLKAIHSSDLNIYLLPRNGNFLLRSRSSDKSPDFIERVIDPKMHPGSMRKKRVAEVFISFGLLLFSPMLVFLYRNPFRFFRNVFSVLNNRSWLTGLDQEQFRGKNIVVYAGEESASDKEKKKSMIEFLLKYSTQKEFEIVFSKIGQLDRMYFQRKHM